MGICSSLFSLLLLFISQTQVMYMAQSAKSVAKHPNAEVGGSEVVRVSSMTIGSLPPRCERRCSSCGHCEAVQVPIAPNHDKRSATAKYFFFRSRKNISSVTYNSRSDDTSNYKPMSWKCKCGGRILNP